MATVIEMNWIEAGQHLPAKENLYYMPEKGYNSYIAVYRSKYTCTNCKKENLNDAMCTLTNRMLENTDCINTIIERLISSDYNRICCIFPFSEYYTNNHIHTDLDVKQWQHQ